MNFVRRFSAVALLLVLFALLSCSAHAETYDVHVILPRTGGLNDPVYEAAADAAELARNVVNSELWAGTGDTFNLVVKDSQSNGARSLSLALAAHDENAIAVVGAGPDNMTLPCAQLLYNFDVRFSRFCVASLLSSCLPRVSLNARF